MYRLRKNFPLPWPSWLSYEPDLIPPRNLMQKEGIHILEEWFRWAEEWSMLLRVYGAITRTSTVMEIGCGLGRTAFPLRYLLSSNGRYEGFEICKMKVDFLKRNFQKAYPNFRFTWADIHNTYYNPNGIIKPEEYSFPYESNSFDLAYAASVFTHLLPRATERYFEETARVLKPGGKAVFSFFLLDNYRPGQSRPLGFEKPAFNFDHPFQHYGNDFAVAFPETPEHMTAFRLSLIDEFASRAGLARVNAVPGIWSGSHETWVGAQDVVVLRKTD